MPVPARLGAALCLLLAAAAALPAQPKIVIDGGTSFDFGELYTTAPVVRELRLSNAGDDTLRIWDVSGSCGCTGTLLSNERIPPGGSGTLKVTFDPAKFRGKVEKTVAMKTNDPADHNPRLTFSAEIIHILDLDPASIIVSTLPDSEVTVTLRVRNVSDVPLRITGVVSSAAELSVGGSGGRLEPGAETSLPCRVLHRKPGIVRGDLTISTDHPLLPTLGLKFFSYAKPAPASTPSGN